MKTEKKIHAMLQVRRVAAEIIEDLIPKLKELKGKKAFKVDGTFTEKAKVKPVAPEVKGYNNEPARLHIAYIHTTNYSLWLKVSASFKDTENTCFYEEVDVYIGEKNKEGVLLNSIESVPEWIRETTTPEEQAELMAQYKEAKAKLKSLEDKIWIKSELTYL
jgi:hypothetical protein